MRARDSRTLSGGVNISESGSLGNSVASEAWPARYPWSRGRSGPALLRLDLVEDRLRHDVLLDLGEFGVARRLDVEVFGDFLDPIALDHVAGPHVLIGLESHAAFLARHHVLHFVLEALGRGELALVHHDVVADQSDVGAALDVAKLGFIDCIGVMIAGSNEDVTQIVTTSLLAAPYTVRTPPLST